MDLAFKQRTEDDRYFQQKKAENSRKINTSAKYKVSLHLSSYLTIKTIFSQVNLHKFRLYSAAVQFKLEYLFVLD